MKREEIEQTNLKSKRFSYDRALKLKKKNQKGGYCLREIEQSGQRDRQLWLNRVNSEQRGFRESCNG